MKLILNIFFKSNLFEKTNTFIIKKILKISKYFFVETNIKSLPEINHPLSNDDLKNYKIWNNKIRIANSIPFISYSHLIDILSIFYSFKKKLIFFDYGAGKLDLYFNLNKKFHNLKYYYYDQQPLLENTKTIKKRKKLSNLIVFDKRNKVKKIDFVYFGGVIQYLKDYDKEISFFFKKAKYIIIAQTPFFTGNSIKKIIVKQLNLHPVVNFLYFINLNYFIKFMKKNEYVLVNKSYNKVIKSINLKNFKSNYKNLQMYDLLFKYEKKK